MRFDTHRARAYFVTRLMATAGITDIHDDGTDIVVVSTARGARVMIHLVERLMPLAELRPLFRENSDAGIHTLPLFWADLLLPAHGQLYEPDQWMQAMLRLQGNCIYGYEVFGDDVFLFGVHFRGPGWLRQIEHSPPLGFSDLQTATVDCEWPAMRGSWLVCGLGELPAHHKAQETRRQHSPFLRADFARLNLPPEASIAEVRLAYRRLARHYHPDNNQAADANARMQLINEAYARIRKQLNSGESA